MASLSIRKLDEETMGRLKRQAAAHGVSMEEEARRILRTGVESREGLGDLAVRIFGPSYGKTAFEPPVREHGDPLKFS